MPLFPCACQTCVSILRIHDLNFIIPPQCVKEYVADYMPNTPIYISRSARLNHNTANRNVHTCGDRVLLIPQGTQRARGSSQASRHQNGATSFRPHAYRQKLFAKLQDNEVAKLWGEGEKEKIVPHGAVKLLPPAQPNVHARTAACEAHCQV